MQSEPYLKQVTELLAKDGNQVMPVQLDHFSGTVGYQSQFKWSWFATKLHLFTVVIYIPELNAAAFTAAVQEAAAYGLKMKGTLRGLQVGVAVTPIIVTQAVDTETQALASARPARGFAVVTTPVIVDITNAQTYTYTGKIIWGAAYTKWLRARLAAVLPPIQKQPIPQEF